MSRPRIGLIGRFAEHTSATRYAGVVSARALLESLWLAGAEPLTLLAAPAPEGTDWPARLRGLDGVLLAGGGDLNPERYGMTDKHPEVYDVDDLQDEVDLSLADYTLSKGMPTLAVCRGLHVVNVLRGGTLLQHMDSHHRHMQHEVTIEPNKADIATGVIAVSCYHHQCIDQLGSGLDVVGRAEDGTIEAVDIEAEGWAFGVQWHPEDNAASDAGQLALLRSFVDASR